MEKWDRFATDKTEALQFSHFYNSRCLRKAVNNMDYGVTNDGIKIFLLNGRLAYEIPCEVCGRKFIRRQNRCTKNRLCDYCKKMLNKKKAEAISQELLAVETKAERRFNKAVERIKKQVKNFEEYQKPIEIAKTRVERYASIPEAMVAIELVRLKYGIIPQQEVGRYKVDFAIPKHKLVVEVDGELFHRKDKNKEREAIIQFALGLEWKIIHIPAELISNDIVKLKDIMDMYVGKH